MTDQEKVGHRPVMTRLSDVTIMAEFLHVHVMLLHEALDQAKEQLNEQTFRVQFTGDEEIGFGSRERSTLVSTVAKKRLPILPIYGLCGDLDSLGFDPHAADVTLDQLADVASRAQGLVRDILDELGAPPGPTRGKVDGNG